jgi:hypothetical protein
MATPNTPPLAFKLHDIIIADIIGKLTTMKPYLERSADIELQTQLSKVYKEVDDLYKQWLQGRDLEVVGPPFEEDWDENAEVGYSSR